MCAFSNDAYFHSPYSPKALNKIKKKQTEPKKLSFKMLKTHLAPSPIARNEFNSVLYLSYFWAKCKMLLGPFCPSPKGQFRPINYLTVLFL
jgi:hypothetical protein